MFLYPWALPRRILASLAAACAPRRFARLVVGFRRTYLRNSHIRSVNNMLKRIDEASGK